MRLFALKGPKREIFISKFFTQSKSVWIDDLGARTLKYIFLCLGLILVILYFKQTLSMHLKYENMLRMSLNY